MDKIKNKNVLKCLTSPKLKVALIVLMLAQCFLSKGLLIVLSGALFVTGILLFHKNLLHSMLMWLLAELCISAQSYLTGKEIGSVVLWLLLVYMVILVPFKIFIDIKNGNLKLEKGFKGKIKSILKHDFKLTEHNKILKLTIMCGIAVLIVGLVYIINSRIQSSITILAILYTVLPAIYTFTAVNGMKETLYFVLGHKTVAIIIIYMGISINKLDYVGLISNTIILLATIVSILEVDGEKIWKLKS